MKHSVVVLLFALSANASASNVKVEGHVLGQKKTIDGITLHNTKVADKRIFHANRTTRVNAPIDAVKSWITDFSNRCNNKYKRRRTVLDKKKDCPYHNNNMVESIVIKNIKQDYTPLANEIERFVVFRNIYNQGYYRHYDVVTVTQDFIEPAKLAEKMKQLKAKLNEKKGDKQQTQIQAKIDKLQEKIDGESKVVFTIQHRAMQDQEAKKYLGQPKGYKSAFLAMQGTYILRQIDDKTTEVEYTYIGQTDHWLLNKDMIVGRVYENIASGTNHALRSLAKGAPTYQ